MDSMEEVEALGQVPILCVDGSFGIVIRYGEREVGVQVPGEDDIRWIDISCIEDLGNGSLVEFIIF